MSKKRKRDRFGLFIQALGSALTGGGIIAEIILRADIWFIVITAGSLIYSLGVKLRGW